MRPSNIVVARIILGLIVLASVELRAIDARPLAAIRNLVFDDFQRAVAHTSEPTSFVTVEIDEESLKRFGQWPWPRSILARLLDRIAAAKPAIVILPVLFPEADETSPAQIAKRLSTLGNYEHILPALAGLPDGDRMLADSVGAVPTITSFALTTQEGEREPQRLPGIALIGPVGPTAVPRFSGAIANIPTIDAQAAGVGATTITPDPDGVVRRLPMVLELRDQLVPSLTAETLRVIYGDHSLRIKTAADGSRGVSIESLRFGTGAQGITVPTDPDGSLRVRFRLWQNSNILSAAQVFDGKLARQLFERPVLISVNAAGLRDLVQTPVGPMTSIEVEAQAIAQVLDGMFLTRPSWASGLEIGSAVLVSGLLLLVLRLRGTLWCNIGAGAAIAMTGFGSWIAFSRFGLLIDASHTSLTALALSLASSLIGYLRAEERRESIRRSFSLYMSPVLVDHLAANPASLKLGGERRIMTVIFTDVAGFTALSEKLEPAVLGTLMNRYFTGVTDAIMRHGGTINEFIGDAVVAFFGAPLDDPNHARAALAAARDVERFSESFQVEQNALGIAFGRTRIGIHTGAAFVGNFGSEQRMKYSALGDTLNIASRIEGANKHFGTNVLASSETVAAAGDTFTRPVAEVVLKGRQGALELHEVLRSDGATSEILVEYRRAYDLVRVDTDAALAAFQGLQANAADDPCISMHVRRLSRGERTLRFVLTEK
jgi:adenylate cyclase